MKGSDVPSCLLELTGVPAMAGEPLSLSDAVIKTGPPLAAGFARVVDGDQHVIGPVSVRQHVHASQAQRIGPGHQPVFKSVCGLGYRLVDK